MSPDTASTPAHDPAGWRQLPASFTPLDPARVEALMAKEWERYAKTTVGSADHAARSAKTLPLGVTSSFQYWDPYPLGIKSARGAYVTDCDDRQVLDLSMGFGAMLVGHLNPTVVAKVKESLDNIGTLFVTSSNDMYLDRNVFRNGLDDFVEINFKLAGGAQCVLALYDLAGHLITTITDSYYAGGWNLYSWDGRRDDGSFIGSGTYVMTLEHQFERYYKKLIIVR